MRWTVKPIPKDNEKRNIKRFLFLPVCLNNECRWLEMASIEQSWYQREAFAPRGIYSHWSNIKWID